MRLSKMIEAKQRIASGFYDDPRVIDRVVDRLQAELADDDFPDEQEISERLFLDASGYDN